MPWKFTNPLVPVEVSPALMLWPAPSKAKSILNFGSFCLPSLWNGPETFSVIGPSTPSAPFASTFSGQVELARLDLLVALERVGQERVDVGVRRRLVARVAAAGGDSQRQSGEQGEQKGLQ